MSYSSFNLLLQRIERKQRIDAIKYKIAIAKIIHQQFKHITRSEMSERELKLKALDVAELICSIR